MRVGLLTALDLAFGQAILGANALAKLLQVADSVPLAERWQPLIQHGAGALWVQQARYSTMLLVMPVIAFVESQGTSRFCALWCLRSHRRLWDADWEELVRRRNMELHRPSAILWVTT